MNINSVLPVEILYRVFSMLEPRDRMEAVKVCHRWKEVCEYPGLWSSVEIEINSSNLHLVSNMASSRRLQFIETIDIYVMESQMTEEHLVSIMQWKILKYLRISCSNIEAWNPKLSASLFSKLEKLSLEYVDLTKVQLEALFTIMKEETSLQSLEMVFMDLSNVTPNLFTALTAVSEVELIESELKKEQIESILSSIQEHTKIQKLFITSNSLSNVDPTLITSLTSLESVCLFSAKLNVIQLQTLLIAMKQGTRLEWLDIAYNDLSSVEPHLLTALVKLSHVDISGTNLTEEQLQMLLNAVTREGSMIKKLVLEDIDLSTVNPALLQTVQTTITIVNNEVMHENVEVDQDIEDIENEDENSDDGEETNDDEDEISDDEEENSD